MALKARKAILLAKKEVTYGVDPIPVGATDAILTSNLSITPIMADVINRNLDKPTIGNDPGIHVGVHVQCTFNVEIAGSGTEDGPPAYGPLLEACGFGETINAGTDVQYAPISENIPSATLYLHFDGQHHIMTGARGDLSLNLSPGTIPVYTFTFTGLYVDPASGADPTPDFSNFQSPLSVSNRNTPTWTLHQQVSNMEQMTINLANQVVYRDVVGNESVELVDRAPTGQVIIEAPAISDKDYFAAALANTVDAMRLTHGTQTGNIVDFTAAVQLLNPTYGDSDGIRTLNMDMNLVPTSAGNDELLIVTK